MLQVFIQETNVANVAFEVTYYEIYTYIYTVVLMCLHTLAEFVGGIFGHFSENLNDTKLFLPLVVSV